MNKYLIIVLLPLCLAACAPTNSDEWQNVDYAKIARDNYTRENDSHYTPPTVTGCVDDDLYNCPVKQR